MNQVLCFISSTVKIIYLITLNIYIALVLSWKRIRLQCRGPWFDSWVGKICWRRDKPPTPVFLGFSGGSAGKKSTCSAGDLGLIPGLGRSPREGKGYPLWYSGLGNFMDCIVHGVAESDTTEQLSLSLCNSSKAFILKLSHFYPYNYHISRAIIAIQ